MLAVTIIIATAPVDEKCKEIMRRMLTAGFSRADMVYVTASSPDLHIDDLRYLLRHGVLDMNDMVPSVLHSFALAGPRGPDAGQMAFSLNVDLA